MRRARSSTALANHVFEDQSNRVEHIVPLKPHAIAALREMPPGTLRIIRGV